jgi:hypothetical protein
LGLIIKGGGITIDITTVFLYGVTHATEVPIGVHGDSKQDFVGVLA